MSYIYEDGKKFWQWDGGGELTRAHDDKFHGPRFRHRRCPFCNRITSIHILHWFNHMKSCAPSHFTNDDLDKLRYMTLNDFTASK